MRTSYKAGEAVPADALYLAIHDRHREPHHGILLVGDTFPYCHTCKGRVRFRVVRGVSITGATALAEHPSFRYRAKPTTAASLFRAAFGRQMSSDEREKIHDAPHAEPLPWNKKKARGKAAE